MNKIKSIIILITFLTIAFSVVSCHTHSHDMQSRFVTVMTNEGEGAAYAQGYPYYFVTDDSLILFPVNHMQYPEFKPNANGRGLASFCDEHKPTTTPPKGTKNIEILEYKSLLVRDVLYTDQIDTTGTDKTTLRGAWYSGGVYGAKRMINFEIQILTQNLPFAHVIELAVDTTKEQPVVDSEGYYCLEFRHNAGKNAGGSYTLIDQAAFPLTEAMTADGVKGLKVTFDTLSEGIQEYKLNYK